MSFLSKWFKPKPATYFAMSQVDPGLACADWIQAVEQGRLEPQAPYVDGIGRLLAPLQFWAHQIGIPRDSNACSVAVESWDGQELLAALPKLAMAGLSLDHMEADRSESIARSNRGHGLWSSMRPQFGHMSPSQRPMLHALIGYDSSRGAGVEAVRLSIQAGADPRSKDAFGVPALALCALHLEPKVGFELWKILVDAGADPCEPFVTNGSAMGGRACVLSRYPNAGKVGEPATPRDLALGPFSLISHFVLEEEARLLAIDLAEELSQEAAPARAASPALRI